MGRRGLVLGAGGVAGIAWETGLLAGLAEGGADPCTADLVVGTSAGSTVAAQVTSGVAVSDLYRRQADPVSHTRELPALLGREALLALFSGAYGETQDVLDRRRRIGAMALAAPTVSEAERRAVIAARLPVHDWPPGDLRIVAVDAESGETRVFDSAWGVELVDAVAASGAVPQTWPPVTIGGRRYIDGATRSAENADLAAGCDRVLVVKAMEIPGVDNLARQVTALREQGSRVVVLSPDAASVAAIGPNLLDPAVRGPAAKAGYRQGLRSAAEAGEFWH
ncbi:MAG TPA: patatin-like phospholipase family protein [Amycolatopsis sp.]|nr:patatin-like phospholipase family protein [Amycolatopsis sp.]